ncbi:hypothetical protein [Chromobacterium haemolyticum]|uniref:hypothetical protein n=1 Tax=Chromobacterium haemolyticum TaxID=394935 RepID=UPI0012FC266E|nr:hypothetical protein [Chromobacterium haemolyticum]
MDPITSSKIIKAAGGDSAFAKLIGLDPADRGVPQRVNNWHRRGIPSDVVLQNLDKLRKLIKQHAATSQL